MPGICRNLAAPNRSAPWLLSKTGRPFAWTGLSGPESSALCAWTEMILRQCWFGTGGVVLDVIVARGATYSG